MATGDVTETILRDIQQRLKAALENAERDRTLAHRAISRVDQFESRLDAIAADMRGRLDIMAADIRNIRSDIAAIDIKLAILPNIEAAIRAIQIEKSD